MHRTALLTVLAAYIAALVKLWGVTGGAPALDPLAARSRFVERAMLDHRFTEALPVALELQREYANDALPPFWLATIYHGLDQPRDEIAAWTAYLRLAPAGAGNACPALASAYARAGDRARALERYQQCVQDDPADPQRLIDLGDALQEAGETRDAIVAYRSAAQLDPRDPVPARRITRLTPPDASPR
jgi:tetratricopeptide (TPR) repeat protein